jgi:predicted alpha/beta superfamily hydrolase
VLVVSVGYRAVTVEDNEAIRQRDLTPTPDPDDPGQTGGAGRFLAFVRDELMPWTRERYGVDTADSTLFGYSLGGLFATWVLLNSPTAFRRYGIGGPALNWDNGVLFEHEAAYARAHDDLPAKAYFGVAAFDSTEGEVRWRSQLPPDRRLAAERAAEGDPAYDFVADAGRMVALLRGRQYPSLEIEYEVLDGEYHQTAPALALSRSLRYLFGAPR